MSNTVTTGLTNISLSPLTGNRMSKGSAPGTWFEALADAWGQTLDKQATRIEAM